MRKLLLAAVLLSVPYTGQAQSLPSLTRSTSTAGLNDSALTLVSDSARRTRASTLLQFRKALSVKAFDSLLTTKLNLTGATVTGAATWSSTQTFAAGQKVDSATGAARSQILTTARTLWGQSFDGSANITGSLTSVGSITGGASSMTITAGTGNSRTLTLQSTTSAGTAKNSLVLGADSSATFLGQGLYYGAGCSSGPSVARAGATTTGIAFSGAGQVDLCLSGVAALQVFAGPTIAANGGAFRSGLGSASTAAFHSSGGTGTGIFFLGGDTVAFAGSSARSLTVSGGATATLVGGAGNMTISAGTGASRTMTLQTTTSGSAVKNTLVLGADSGATFLGKIVSGDTIRAANVVVTGSSGAFRAGTTGSVALVAAGTSNSAYVQPTNASGSSINAMVATADSSVALLNGGRLRFDGTAGDTYIRNTPGSDTLTWQVGGTLTRFTTSVRDSTPIRAVFTGDTMRVTGKPRFTALTSASGTPNSVCINSSTKEIVENAALTCTVSSARYKKDILPLTNAEADKIVFGLKPKSFTYKDGGRKSIHVIAEQADSIDKRIPTYDAQGRPNSVDDAVILTAVLQVVQRQQARLDALCKSGVKAACP